MGAPQRAIRYGDVRLYPARQLEKNVLATRAPAESGARAALRQRAVDQSEPFAHMSPDERDLRVKLRARGRQIGDIGSRSE